MVLVPALLSGLTFVQTLNARMPVMAGNDLNGRPWVVPAGLPGGKTLVLVGFEESQQEAIDTWTQGLGLNTSNNSIPWIEMPLIENPGMLMRWFINTGMRNGIKDPETRSHIWTAYTDKKSFMRSCGVVSDETIFAMVVDRSGQVLLIEQGTYSMGGETRLLKALGCTKN